VDSAGRRVEVPAKIDRVFVAGGPASVFIYTLAPDKLLGWNRPLVLSEIKALAKRGIAVILSTHDPDQAFLCAHRVAILHQGRLAHLGPPQEVITAENLRAIFEVEVKVWPIERGDGEALRVCVPSLTQFHARDSAEH